MDTDNQPTVIAKEYFDLLLARIRNQRTASIDIIPIGKVWFHIEQLIESGVITELNNAYDLYRDDYHANDIGKSVIAWTLYATLFHESAVGIALGDIYSCSGDSPIVMDDVLALKLQHAVNDVVFSPRADANSDGISDEDALRLGLLYKVDHMGNFTELPENVWTRPDARSLMLTLTDGCLER